MSLRTDRDAHSWLRLVAIAPAALYLITVTLCAARTRADGYDGVGFVLAIKQLDLLQFQPQPPGYPLFVALGRLLHGCGLSQGVALAVVNAVLWGAGISALATAIERAVGRLAGWLCAALITLAPLSFVLGIATVSDGAGLGGLLLAAALLFHPSAAACRAGGVVLGLALGVRPTYAPLAALMLVVLGISRGFASAVSAWATATLATLGWLIPFSLLIGTRTLWETSRAHLFGHVTMYGGSIATDSALGARLSAFVSGLGEAALGTLWPLALVLLGFSLWRRPPALLRPCARRLCGYLLGALGAYSLWVLLLLPVGGHGRHLLPAVTALLCLLAIVVGEAVDSLRDQRRRRAVLLAGALFLAALGGVSARAVWLFRQPSPGMALADYVTARYPRGTLLYGAAGARYLDLSWGSGSAHQTLYFGDVMIEAERMSRLPEEVLLTSEVAVVGAHRLRSLARFCFDPRLPAVLRFERYPAGCVELRAYRFRPSELGLHGNRQRRAKRDTLLQSRVLSQ